MKISSPSLPGAVFASRKALLSCVQDAVAYEATVRRFSDDRDSQTLAEDLDSLGYTAKEIEWHIRQPGKRMEQEYR